MATCGLLKPWTPLIILVIFIIQGAQAISARNQSARLAQREQVLDETIRLTRNMKDDFNRQNQRIEVLTQLLKRDIRDLREIKSAIESKGRTASVAELPIELPPQE